MNCCCHYGAAVSGEYPEFDCVDCEQHGGDLGALGYRCRRHAREAATVTVLPPTVQQAGDPRRGDATWSLLPVDTRSGECGQCGKVHRPEEPHDPQRLYYQYAFYAEHGRWPTWADALAHCTDEVYEMWREALAGYGEIVEPRQSG